MPSKKVTLSIVGICLVLALVSTYLFTNRSNDMSSIAQPAGIGGGMMREDAKMERGITSSMTMPYFPGDDALNVQDRTNLHFATYELEVKDVAGYLARVKQYVESVNGVILQSSQNSYDRTRSGYLAVKVPVSSFTQATQEITKDIETVVTEQISTQDITGQVESQKERLEQLKTEKSTKEIELVDAQNQIDRRRIELQIEQLNKQIQAMEAQINSTTETVQYATINISVADKAGFFDPNARRSLSDEIRRAVESLKDLGYLLGYVLIWTAVYAVVLVPTVLIVKFLWNRFRRTKVTHES